MKIFLIEKLKCSTNLNHKEGKQEEKTIVTICPRVNYVGYKSSKRNFFLGAISRGFCQGAIIIFGVIFREQKSGSNYLGGGALFLGGNCPRGKLSPEGNYPREQLYGLQSSRGQLSGWNLIFTKVNKGGATVIPAILDVKDYI